MNSTLKRDIRRYVMGVLGAAALSFLWSVLFWMNPLPYRVLERAPDDYAAGNALLEHFPESGTYLIPSFYTDNKNLDPLREGPLAMLYLTREGKPTPLRTLLPRGFLLILFSITLLALILWRVLPSLPTSYGKRTMLVTGFGIVSAVFSHGADVIWWFHPANWHLVVLLYTSVLWLIVGMILAKIFKPHTAQVRRKGVAPGMEAPAPVVPTSPADPA